MRIGAALRPGYLPVPGEGAIMTMAAWLGADDLRILQWRVSGCGVVCRGSSVSMMAGSGGKQTGNLSQHAGKIRVAERRAVGFDDCGGDAIGQSEAFGQRHAAA